MSLLAFKALGNLYLYFIIICLDFVCVLSVVFVD